MKRYIGIFIWIFLTATVSASGLGQIAEITPELSLVFVLAYTSVEERFSLTAWTAAAAGLAVSALGGRSPGFGVLWYLYSAVALYGVTRTKYFAKFFPALFAMFLTTLLGETLYYLLHFRAQAFSFNGLGAVFAVKLLPAAILNSIWMMILYPLVRRMFRKKDEYVIGESI